MARAFGFGAKAGAVCNGVAKTCADLGRASSFILPSSFSSQSPAKVVPKGWCSLRPGGAERRAHRFEAAVCVPTHHDVAKNNFTTWVVNEINIIEVNQARGSNSISYRPSLKSESSTDQSEMRHLPRKHKPSALTELF
jgi:hypothetical protein